MITDKERVIKYIMNNLIFEIIGPVVTGCICLNNDVKSKASSDQIDLEIVYGGSRSIVKNKAIATEIYRRALDLTIK